MKKSSVPAIIDNLVKQGKQWVTIEPEPRLDKSILRAAILEILNYEHLIDIKISRIPMCFSEDAFNHLDNSPAGEKRKNSGCAVCKFNFFCNGFFPEMEEYTHPIPDLPNEVVIEVTDKCNLSCSFCFNKFEYALKERNRRSEMSEQEICDIISKIKEMGVKIVRFSGGEPLLRKDIFRMMEFARSLGLSVWLNTNGTLINEANARQIIEYVENVLIPLNGFDAGSDEAETGLAGSFEKKMQAIRLLNSKCLVRCGVVLSKLNSANLELLYKIAKSNKIRVMEFYRPIGLGLDSRHLAKAIISISALNRKFNRNFRIANPIPFCYHKQAKRVSTGGIYDDGATRMVIDSTGMIKPSYYLIMNMGDAPSGLWNSWNSEKWRELRELKIIPKECNECSEMEICRGGSRALAMLNSGLINGRDPLMKSPLKK